MSLSFAVVLAVEVSRDVEIGPRVAIPVACPRGGGGGLNLRAWGCGCFRGPESGALAVQPDAFGRVACPPMEGRRGASPSAALGAQSEVFPLMLRQVRNIRNIRHTVDFASVFLACCRNSIRNIRHGIRNIRNRSATGFPLKTLGCCACCACCACGRGRGRDVSGPGVSEVRPFITLGRCLPDPHCSRLNAVLAKPTSEPSIVQWLAFHFPPRSLLDPVQPPQDYLGRELLCLAKPKLGSASLESATSATAATRPRAGHSPPTASATAIRDSHTSASRS
jgi:hypothetical protein